MLDFSKLETWLGLAVLVVIAGQFVLIVYQNRMSTKLVSSLIDFVDKIQASPQALDLLEGLATKVVPAWMVKLSTEAIGALEELTPDEWDVLLEKVKEMVGQVTDNEPNIPKTAPPSGGVLPPGISRVG